MANPNTKSKRENWRQYVASQLATVGGSLLPLDNTWTGDNLFTGAFTSIGINDDATASRVILTDGNIGFGDSVTDANFSISKKVNDAALHFHGGAGILQGGGMALYGASSTFFPGDVFLRSGANNFLWWDESNGFLTLSSGVGSKTTALSINSAQKVTLGGGLEIPASISLGVGANGTIGPTVADKALLLNGGVGASGGNIQLFGGTNPSFPGDILFRSGINSFMVWDESVGDLEILTGIGAKTAALTIDSSQGATFAGAFTSLGIDDNATGTRLTLTDAFAIIGGSGATYEIIRGGSAGSLEISGSTGSDSGGNIELFGSTHATRANDMEFRANGNIWMQWDESVGDLEILTGTGAKTSSVTFQANGQIGLGPAGTSGYNIIRNSSTAGITISGGSSAALGGNIFLLGETHASVPGDLNLRSGTNSFLVWDESVGDLEILTGIGAKTSALTINADQSVDITNHIGFPATQVPSAGANDLDDYREGTWTVEMYDSLTGGNVSATTITGNYTRVGNIVCARFNSFNNIDTTGMTAGNFIYITLPFAAAFDCIGVLMQTGLTMTANYTMLSPLVSSTRDRFHIRESGPALSDLGMQISTITSTTDDIDDFCMTYLAE